MLEPRWTYSNPKGLTQGYGHVDYYGPYVIGQWFSLNAETRAEHWSRRISRANSVHGCSQDVIVASETRSDGPWTADFGIYGIDARSGELLWTGHRRGIWGRIVRAFDYLPLFTNELRDRPQRMIDRYLLTSSGRVLDIQSGRDCQPDTIAIDTASAPENLPYKLYTERSLRVEGETIHESWPEGGFSIHRSDAMGREIWRFSAKEISMHVGGNYCSYRLHKGRIFVILGDAPSLVPINPKDPMIVKPNPANYHLGILDLNTGKFECVPLANPKQRTKCRIEGIRDSRMLVSCDDTFLAEYEIGN
jgi:hypothetical protein